MNSLRSIPARVMSVRGRSPEGSGRKDGDMRSAPRCRACGADKKKPWIRKRPGFPQELRPFSVCFTWPQAGRLKFATIAIVEYRARRPLSSAPRARPHRKPALGRQTLYQTPRCAAFHSGSAQSFCWRAASSAAEAAGSTVVLLSEALVLLSEEEQAERATTATASHAQRIIIDVLVMHHLPAKLPDPS